MSNRRLLIIEDDFDVAEMLLLYFQANNYEVLHADTGHDGIELARTKFPHLILLDVMLPDLDGYEICYRLRNMSLTKYIPTLFLTQKDERASKVKGLELGADDYITKPFDIDELRLRVENAIRRATRENLNEPRTGLPMGVLIQEERRRRGTKLVEITFQLHGFDTYQEVYSFMAASDVLYHAGQTIRDILSENKKNDAFVGIVNNKFVVMLDDKDTQQLQEQITQRFNEKVRAFYSLADANRGGLLLNVGQENETLVPMMSLTTGDPQPPKPESADSVSNLLDW